MYDTDLISLYAVQKCVLHKIAKNNIYSLSKQHTWV